MAAIPGSIEMDEQPPMTVPLGHFVVGLAFLFVGTLVGLGAVAASVPGFAGLAQLHLLLAGWVCVTIMGAMTQFVPVWSGVALHSQRLASAQLALVAVGLVGFVGCLLASALSWLPAFGALMVAGFWTFAYNVGRTLLSVDDWDVTERHFALSLSFFVALTTLGFLLAVDFTHPVIADLSLARPNVREAHATLAVFGAVLTTVYGALYQLATMFTQTELHGVDEHLRAVESVGHPLGVVLLAAGRLLDVVPVAQVGGVLVLAAALSVSVILARKLAEMRVERTPMHVRYAVVAVALAAWALVTAPAWVSSPTASTHLFGASGSVHLLVLGVIGFVVFGTLYHVVPFIVWVHRYSDRLGLEPVPMIDDLYSDRLATADVLLLGAGTTGLVLAGWFDGPGSLTALSGVLLCLGILAFAANLLLVVRNHSPQSLRRILTGSLGLNRGDRSTPE
ncbi:hypothetical protein [Halorubellus sp. PRR65]|uniref:hypothetical protein n=1 Tax=Halorubellus sp. PRR65 TaxID=3098148 RepID=UPI002B2640A6|nr:hypothetical protein [Halorubellus sp. PRR65]